MVLQKRDYQLLTALCFLLLKTTADAFVIAPLVHATSSLPMAGFGGGGGGRSPSKNKKGKKKEYKLKPKQQWDRYTNSDAGPVRVAVRVAESSAPTTNDNAATVALCWYEIGAVKSKDDAYTDAAVIRQRGLMAEHARRMFPLKILANDVLEWGYTTMQGEDVLDESWVAPIKVQSSNLPDDIEKLIGFQGLEDSTGFYAFNKKAAMVDDNLAGDFESINAKRIF